MTIRRYAITALCITALAGCAGTPDKDETVNWSASRLYDRAKQSLENQDYENGLKDMETLVSRYPFGPYAQQAQLDIAYGYYKKNEPDAAVAAADQYIKLYPRDAHVAYAWYLKGLAVFNRGMSDLEYLVNQDPAERDPRAARESLQSFLSLLRQFPDSIYTQDAQLRVTYLRNNLARYEMVVAHYYLRHGAYVAAAGRAKHVLEIYPTSQSLPEALVVMIEAYRQLGLSDLERDAQRVLEKNFPQDAQRKPVLKRP